MVPRLAEALADGFVGLRVLAPPGRPVVRDDGGVADSAEPGIRIPWAASSTALLRNTYLIAAENDAIARQRVVHYGPQVGTRQRCN